MPNLETTYLGLKLKSPIIASSSGITSNIQKIKELETHGAGAIVLKSLFEEQILLETSEMLKNNDYPEAEDYIRSYSKGNTVKNYIQLIQDAKAAVNIPIIASINCVSSDDWVDFAQQIELAGANALELNIYIVPTDAHLAPANQELKYLEIVQEVRKQTKLPIAVKLSKQFTNLPNMVEKLSGQHINAVVLFNRFYEPDIDIENLDFVNSNIFSSPSDIRSTLRWVGLLSQMSPKVEISASTGVHNAEAAIKLLLAGANTVQVASVLYKEGTQAMKQIVEGISQWMDSKQYPTIDAFRGKMSYRKIKNPGIYERAQFLKYFSSID